MEWQILQKRGLDFNSLETQQNDLVARARAGEAFLLLSEPTATYTGGRGAPESDLLWSAEEREQRGIALHRVSRGGKWTYHGPGQVVAYPIVRLAALGYGTRGVRAFLEDFREAVRVTVESFGVRARAGEEPFGVYVGEKKIASFGIAVQRGVITHGVALYVLPQLAAFSGMNPCGVPAARLTSFAEEGVSVTWSDAAARLSDAVKKILPTDR